MGPARLLLAVLFVSSAAIFENVAAQTTVSPSVLMDDIPTRNCFFRGEDVICPVCITTEMVNSIVVCTEWEEEINPESTTEPSICITQDVQCGSRNDTSFDFNPDEDDKDDSPCCDGFACKPDPVLSVGNFSEAFFCTNCTKPLQRCAGDFNRTYIDYAPCCYNETTPHVCLESPDLGPWGNFCVPATPEPSPVVRLI